MQQIHGFNRVWEQLERLSRYRLQESILATGEGSRKYFPITISGVSCAREVFGGPAAGLIDGDRLEEFGLLG